MLPNLDECVLNLYLLGVLSPCIRCGQFDLSGEVTVL